MIQVTAAIIQFDSKILIARRSPGLHLAGYWEFPGGKMEEGESPEICLKREIEEELGLIIQVGDFLLENLHDYGDRRIQLKAYLCELISGEIVLIDHDRYVWVEVNSFHAYTFAPADMPIVDALIKQKK